MRRLWRNPGLGLTLSLVLLGDLLFFSLMAPFHFGWLCTPFVLALNRGGGSFRPVAPITQVWQRGDEILLVDPTEATDWPDDESLIDRDIFFAWICPKSTGLVAPVLTYDHVRVLSAQGEQALNPAELETANRLYAEHLVECRNGIYKGTDFPELVLQGGGEYRDWSVPAFIHDALFVLAIPLALSGLWQARQDHQRERMLARAESGVCPYCRYDITGAGDRCPECGNTIPVREGDSPQAGGPIHWDSTSDPLP